MTVTYRKSKARKQAENTYKKIQRRHRYAVEPEPDLETFPPTDYFTPSSPEPSSFYNFIEEWNRGILPNNNKLLKFLDGWQTSPVLAADNRLSPAGLTLVSDLKEFGATIAKIIRERNSDELLQRFVGHLRLAGRVVRRGQRSGRMTLVEDIPNQRRFRIFGRRDAQVQKELLRKKDQARKDIQDLLTLGQLVITSVDFRSLVNEMQQLITRAIEIKPKDSQPETSKKASATETTFSASANETPDIEELRKKTEGMREEIRRLREQTTVGSSSIFQEQRVPSLEFYPPGTKTAQEDKSRATTSTLEEPPIKSALTKETGTDEIEELLIDARKVFKKLAENHTFRDAIDGIYDILIRWQSGVQSLSGTVIPNDLQYDANFQAAQQDLIILMERFANGASVRPLVDSMNEMRVEALKDYELLDFLRDWRSFLIASTSNPEYLEHQEYLNRGRYLLERTAEYGDKKYRRLFRENMQSWTDFMRGWQSDKLTTELGNIVSKIFSQDLFGQTSGSAGGVAGSMGGGFMSFAQVQSSLLKDLQNVILPAILRELYELPLPHMELEQGAMKASFDDVVLPAQLLAPSVLDVHTAHRLHLSPRDRLLNITTRAGSRTKGAQWQTGTRIILSGMRGEIKNVRFAMARTAWPRLRDRGRVDVRVGGRGGLSVLLDLATELRPNERVFHLSPAYVRVKMSTLRLKFYEVQHETFFAIMRPYLQAILKRRMERALCDRIVITIEQFNRITKRLAKSAAATR